MIAKGSDGLPDIDWSTGGGGAGFGNYDPSDEMLHPAAGSDDPTVSETWLYMWYVPEARIGAWAYVWMHPNLDVLTSGITVYQGHKRNHLECELMDFRAYLPGAILRDGGMGRDVRVPNGLHVEILEPAARMRIRYQDAERGNAVDVRFTAASPPIMRENGRHFDQVLMADGTMTLGGRDYRVTGHALRDRSWGEPRPEHRYPIPPFTWMTGTFPTAGISWHLCAYDDPARAPDWLGRMETPEKIFREGWMFRDGEMLRLRAGTQVTRRDPHTLVPISAEVRLTDSRNRTYEISGVTLASTLWSNWPNMSAHVGLAQWELNGEIGWGDLQEFQSPNYVRAMLASP
jgi:hypothetical protein